MACFAGVREESRGGFRCRIGDGEGGEGVAADVDWGAEWEGDHGEAGVVRGDAGEKDRDVGDVDDGWWHPEW